MGHGGSNDRLRGYEDDVVVRLMHSQPWRSDIPHENTENLKKVVLPTICSRASGATAAVGEPGLPRQPPFDSMLHSWDEERDSLLHWHV